MKTPPLKQGVFVRLIAACRPREEEARSVKHKEGVRRFQELITFIKERPSK